MSYRVFSFECAVLAESKQPDDRREAQPLPDQRHQDDREGEEDHQIALREGHATGECQGQGQGRGQGEAPAHADPGHDRDTAPSGIGVAGAQASTDQARQRGRGKDPGETHSDDGQADQQRLPDEREQRMARNGCQDAAQLQPDQQKEQAVEQEDQHVPDGVGLQARIGGEEARRLATQVQPAERTARTPDTCKASASR